MLINQIRENRPVNPKYARLSGIYLIASVVSITICLGIIIPRNLGLDPVDIVSTLNSINLHSIYHILELIFDEITNVLTILMAGALFLAFGGKRKALALSASLLIASGGIVMLIHDMGNFALTWIAKMHANASTLDQMVLEKIGTSIILTAKWGVTIGAACIVLGFLIYMLLWIVEAFIPKVLGYIGIVCGVLALGALLPYWIDFSLESLGYNLYFPMMIWELAAGVWLIRLKGKSFVQIENVSGSQNELVR